MASSASHRQFGQATSDSGMTCGPPLFGGAVTSIPSYPFVAVIEKRDEALHPLVAEKHGTEWQPFGHKHLR